STALPNNTIHYPELKRQPGQETTMQIRIFMLSAVAGLLLATSANAQDKARTYSRLFWQDSDTQTIQWGDLKRAQEWQLKGQTLAGQPELDAERQMFVQMQRVENLALLGIRDDDDGGFSSGWFAFDSGVEQEAHGDHFHWHFSSAPKLIESKLDKEQGNPAHVYLYDEQFYIANDKKNGFTVVAPNQLGDTTVQSDVFFEAGGGHITLAAVGGQVAYSTWIDRAGDNMGRVDVVGLGSNQGNGYHFHLPSGGIHGATANSGKVFFAPTDGVCWVAADMAATSSESDVDIHHISLGENADGSAKRTGAFTNAGKNVLFTIGGRSGSPELCVLDASSPKPKVSKISLPVSEGHTISTPTAIRSRTGAQFALLFEEQPGAGEDEKLHVIALDPNRDGNFGDAELKTSLPIGKSLIEGHSGHHSALPISKRYVAISNPGDGTISILSTSSWQIESTLDVGGTPTRMVSFGGP
ncbi:MAG: hypothetical protein AAGG44_18600, partial [Planctomycetota bacterium]